MIFEYSLVSPLLVRSFCQLNFGYNLKGTVYTLARKMTSISSIRKHYFALRLGCIAGAVLGNGWLASEVNQSIGWCQQQHATTKRFDLTKCAATHLSVKKLMFFRTL